MSWEILKAISEKLLQELLVFLSVLVWVILRVGGVILKRVEEGKPVTISVLGHDIVDINKRSRTQLVKGKIPAKGE